MDLAVLHFTLALSDEQDLKDRNKWSGLYKIFYLIISMAESFG